jgi:hypothetical protein
MSQDQKQNAATAAERVEKLSERFITELSDELKSGRSERLVRFLSAMARFHDYSLGNALLIATQRPDATQVAGFHTWKELGRQVCRGEKGIAIRAPLVYARRDDNGAAEASNTDPLKVVRGFRVVYVFDVSQTDGEPLPGLANATGDPEDFTERLSSQIRERGIELLYSDSLGTANGASMGGKIAIRQGLSPAEEFSTLVHELAHELLHRNGEQRPSKTVRETEAEAVAFVVSRAIGLDATHAAADYIGLYQGNVETLQESLARVHSTASEILSELIPAQDLTTDQAPQPEHSL